jgi:hypothetical protein
MSSVLDPNSVPVDWKRYLYCSILLPWETNLQHKEVFPRFGRNRPSVSVRLQNMVSLRDVELALHGHLGGNNKQSFIIFYCGKDQAYRALFKLLRKCVAHGHYGCANRVKIAFRHYHGEKLRLFGSLKFSELKEIIAFVSYEASGAT